MSRVYEVTLTLRDEDPDNTEQKINANFRVNEDDVALLPEVILIAVDTIIEADKARKAT